MAGATVLSVGSVTIAANGGQAGDLLAAIMKASAGATIIQVTSADASIPAAAASGGPFELVIDPGYAGPLFVPPSSTVVGSVSQGYAYVVYGGTGTLSGGDPSTAIIGDNLSYTGSAATLIGSGGGGTVQDSATGALMSFFGNYSVTATGNNDTISVDNGSNTKVTVTGSGSVIDLGGGSSSVSAAAAGTKGVTTLDAAGTTGVTTLDIAAGSTGDAVNVGSGMTDLLFISAPTTINASGGSSTVVTGTGGHVTLNATGGSEIVFDHDGSNLINASTSTEYVTAVNVGSSAYNAAAGGADTIFASTGIDYSNSTGTANSLFFLGGAGAVTVSAAAAETVFGGGGGGSYSIGATSFEFFGGAGLGGGGADSLIGGTGSSSVLAFGGVNESLMISQAAGTAGNTIVSFGENDSINASLAAGGNTWQVVNQALPNGVGVEKPTLPGTFTGDSTLVGSTAGSDLFVVYIDASSPPVHTVDIANWQATDTLFLSNLANPDQSLNATDLAAVNAFDGGTAQTLTLSDGTTIDFTGARPTTIAHV